MYHSGELRDRVKILREQPTPDGIGGNTSEWVSQGTYWAHVRPLSGREVTDYDRVNAEIRYLFVFRNSLDVFEGDQLEWAGDQFNIRTIKKPKNKRLFIEIEAERGVAQ